MLSEFFYIHFRQLLANSDLGVIDQDAFLAATTRLSSAEAKRLLHFLSSDPLIIASFWGLVQKKQAWLKGEADLDEVLTKEVQMDT